MMNENLNRSRSLHSLRSSHDDEEEDPNSLESSSAFKPPISANTLGKSDTKLVNRSKYVVYFVLFLSAVLCGTIAYFFMEDEDIRWYTTEFEERSLEVSHGVQDLLERSLQAGEHMSASLIFETVDLEDIPLPNLTYPTFGITAGHLMKRLTGGQMIGIAHAVSANDRAGYEAYAVEHQGWIKQDLFLSDLGNGNVGVTFPREPGKIREHIYGNDDDSAEWSAPLWQMYPTPTNASQAPIMFDLLSQDWLKRQWDFSTAWTNGTFQASIGSIHEDIDFLVDYAAVRGGRDGEQDIKDPKFLILQPIVEGIFVQNIQSMGIIVFSWTEYFQDILQDQPAGIIVDLHDNCPTSDGDKFSFKSNKDSVMYIGKNIDNGNILPELSHHFSLYGKSLTDYFADFAIAKESCGYVIAVHATEEFIEQWQRDISYIAAFFIVAAFGFTALVFFVYTYFVQKRNRFITSTAERSTAIVSSLFPKKVADQMMQEVHHDPTSSKRNSTMEDAIQLLSGSNTTHADRSALDSSQRKAPIASSFTETTIMFADIAGFTAWSAKREPAEVFTLLETIFNAFDRVAERRRVFKVETVGDCYVAVCGLPEPRPDHAIVMARYASDCRNVMQRVKRKLGKKLGPDAADLDMRFGLHSGPVTAGVIRGTNPRFQLFGDSMNKTSRIESSGEKGQIHMSEETAKILIGRGKDFWVRKREDVVQLKGLGAVPTYWLCIDSDSMRSRSSLSTVEPSDSDEPSSEDEFMQIKTVSKKWRNTSDLVTWHAKYLFKCLSEVAQARTDQRVDEEVLQVVEREAVFGKAEPLECIQFDFSIQHKRNGSSAISPDKMLLKHLEGFVQEIVGAYNPLAFHSVHHASHVVLSLQKILQSFESNPLDPMTQFALVVSALVHDVDHPGVSNIQLIDENDALAKIYATSTAERNSLDVFWNIFGQECFLELRRAVYRTPSEFEHFRQVIVHTILATDIMDKRMQQVRVRRWTECLNSGLCCGRDQLMTSIVEQLIQAADISHTMQEWEVYQQWNHRLYGEMTVAFQDGRGDRDPSEFWYQGEFGFFDYVVVPLATCMAQHKELGTSGQVMLRHAKKNREEWEREGEAVVMKLQCESKKPASIASPMERL